MLFLHFHHLLLKVGLIQLKLLLNYLNFYIKILRILNLKGKKEHK